jgi:hypothetical protein
MAMDKHEAAHLIDRQLCTVVPELTRINEASYAVGAGPEWRTVLKAVQALHAKAMVAHQEYVRAAAAMGADHE